MPGLRLDLRLAGENHRGGASTRKEETARGDLRSANTDIVAGWCVRTLGTERKEVTRDRTNVSGQAVPEPELDTVALAHAVKLGLQPTTGEMSSTVDRFAGRENRGMCPRHIKRDATFIGRGSCVLGGIKRSGALDLVEPPVGQRPGSQNRLSVGAMLFAVPAPGLPRNLLEQRQDGGNDSRLSLDL